MKLERKKLKAQEFEDLEWINSPPVTISELKGKIVLLDFWRYTCIHCLRSIPYLKIWNSRYEEKGLFVIGVHTPEFSFTTNSKRVKKAVEDLGIQYSIALDNKFTTWKKYSNRYLPTKYLIDNAGYMADFLFGEGGYEKLEESIQVLLKEINPQVVLPKILETLREEDRYGVICRQTTSDAYLGYKIGRLGNREGFDRENIIDYKLPSLLHHDICYVKGKWQSFPEFLEFVGDEGEILINYEAKEVYVLIGHESNEIKKIFVYQNEKPLGKDIAGEDIKIRNGESFVEVIDYKLCSIVKNPKFERSLLTIKTFSKGLKFFAFSFVSSAL